MHFGLVFWSFALYSQGGYAACLPLSLSATKGSSSKVTISRFINYFLHSEVHLLTLKSCTTGYINTGCSFYLIGYIEADHDTIPYF